MAYAYLKLEGMDLGFVRLGGAGLGNCFIPWSRYFLAVRTFGLVPLAPVWAQIKPLMWLKGHRKRFYGGYFKATPNAVGRLRTIWLRQRLRRHPETELDAVAARDPETVFEFSGLRDYFDPLIPHHRILRDKLRALTRERHLGGFSRDFSRSISVHIRLGDFSVSKDIGSLLKSGWNLRIPLEWYVAVITRLRSLFGSERTVYVFSDGRDDELKSILALPNTVRQSFGSALADLWALSRAEILVASASIFSMWASFLGRMPVIWHPGQMRQRFYADRPGAEIEVGLGDLEKITTAFPHS